MNAPVPTMERIRAGARLANRNWQLVVIQVLMGIAILVAALLFIALPAGALLVAMGISAGAEGYGIADFILGKAADPVALATKSVAAILLLVVSACVFAAFAVSLSALVAGGSTGVFWMAVSTGERFRFEHFISEAKRLFWGMLMFTLTVTSIAVLLLIVFGVAAGLGTAAYKAAGIAGMRMGVFFTTAGWLTLGACAAFFFFYLYMLVLQGTVIVAHENPGSMAALRKAYSFIEDDAGGRRLLIALAGGYLGVEFIFGVLGALMEHIPGLGTVIAMPYQIGANLFGVYLGLCVLGGLVAYYNDAVVRPAEDALFRELEDASADTAESYIHSLSAPPDDMKHDMSEGASDEPPALESGGTSSEPEQGHETPPTQTEARE